MELCSVLQLGSTKFGSTFESTAALNYSSRPKLQLGSVHVKIDLWTRPNTQINSLRNIAFSENFHSHFMTFIYTSRNLIPSMMWITMNCTGIPMKVNKEKHKTLFICSWTPWPRTPINVPLLSHKLLERKAMQSAQYMYNKARSQ